MKQHLQNQLLGCLIGLARTCSNNPVTENTPGLLMAGLLATAPDSAFTEDQLKRLLQRVQEDKARVSPNCVSCTHRCGKNDDYDVSRILLAPKDVCDIKMKLLQNLRMMAKLGRANQLLFDSLFALAEDWEAEAFRWYVEQTAQEIMPG